MSDYYQFNIGSHFVSALINGDYSGLNDQEGHLLDTFVTWVGDHLSVDVLDGEPSFNRCDVSGLQGDCLPVRFYIPLEV